VSITPSGQDDMTDGIDSGLIALSDIATQMLEDVNQLYGRLPRRMTSRPNLPISPQLQEKLDGAKAGELLLIATRSKGLREAFLLQSAFLALEEVRSLTIFSGGESFHRFTRRLVGGMADIPPEAVIYDGQLVAEELLRLLATLTSIRGGKLFMSTSRLSHIEAMCDSYRRTNKKCESGDLIFVDHFNTMMDSKYRVLDPILSLIRLKKLAEEMRVPVIAMYQLDSNVAVLPNILTRGELRELEKYSEISDAITLMNGAAKEIFFNSPKIFSLK
jgi:replicative DNA helicase